MNIPYIHCSTNSEELAIILSNKRLNDNFGKTANQYASFSLLDLIFGFVDMDNEDVLIHIAIIIAAFLDGDGCINHDNVRSCATEVNGIIRSKKDLAKSRSFNYDMKGDSADLENDIIPHFERNPTMIHYGKAPVLVLKCCCAIGIRSSSLMHAIMIHLNRICGDPRGVVSRWKNNTNKLGLVGYEKQGNTVYCSFDNTNGPASELVQRRTELLAKIEMSTIIKKEQVSNLRQFPSAGYREDWTVSEGKRQVAPLTQQGKLERERVRRNMLIRDKQLKNQHKKAIKDGLANPETKEKYSANFETVKRIPRNKALPEGCIHAESAGMAMADGSVTHEIADISQVNHSFNVVWNEKVGKNFGNLICSKKKVGPSTYEGMMVYLLSIGLHFSHRKEQVVVAIVYHLFFHRIGLDTKFDLVFLSNEITMKWKSLNEMDKTELRGNVEAWKEGENCTREYQDDTALFDVDEINSILKVGKEVWKMVLFALKMKDPS